MVYELNDEVLRSFVHFSSVDEMNEAVRGHKGARRLTPGEGRVLDVIARFACKYVGVCYMSKAKLAVLAGYRSRRSVIRVCKRLEEYGIIKQYETRRAKGDRGQTVNIMVIQGFVSRADVTGVCHGLETSIHTINRLDLDTDETVDVVKLGLKRGIPSPFYEGFSPFFTGEDMYEVFGVLLRAKAAGEGDDFVSLEDYAEDYMDVFYSVVRQYKRGVVQNFNGYLYASWKRLTVEIVRQRVYGEWMEDEIEKWE